MPSSDDLKAAVAADIISADQSDQLLAFLNDRTRIVGQEDPEALHFVRGMHDILMTLGLLLVLSGLFPLLPSYFSFVGLAAAWGLAEYFTARKRLVLPSIVLAGATTLFGAIICGSFASGLFEAATGDAFEEDVSAGISIAGGALLSALLFYWRFRLPFSLALVAASTVGVILNLLELGVPGFVEAHLGFLFLLFGFLIFVFAMREDMADPTRETTRSDNAFWLHLLAAPAIIHGLIGQRLDGALLVLAAMTLVTLVALIIDRRAMLVSGLGYLTIALGTLVQGLFSSGDDFFGVTLTPLVVGALVLVIGVSWARSRAMLLPLLPTALSARLRPAITD
jgi:hypothetical protein